MPPRRKRSGRKGAARVFHRADEFLPRFETKITQRVVWKGPIRRPTDPEGQFDPRMLAHPGRQIEIVKVIHSQPIRSALRPAPTPVVLAPLTAALEGVVAIGHHRREHITMA